MARVSGTEVAWLTARIDDVTRAIRTNTGAHSIPLTLPIIRSIPIDPAWKAANTNGLVSIMPQQDVKAFAEVDLLVSSVAVNVHDRAAWSRRLAFEQRFRMSASSQTVDFTTATRTDLIEDLTLLSEELNHARWTYSYTLYLKGCLKQVIRGERDLDRIDDAENVSDNGNAPYSAP